MAAEDGTRERIKAVALGLFAQQGYSASSLREIAEGMGFTKAALYYHFRTKDDLLSELMAPLLDDADALLDAAERDGSPPDELIERYVDLLVRHRDLGPLVSADLSVLSHPHIGPHLAEQSARIMTLLVGPEPSERTRLRGASALQLLGGILTLDWASAELLRAEIGDHVRAVLAPAPV